MTSYIGINPEILTPRVAYSCIYRECRIQNDESTFYFKGKTPTLAVQTAIDNANQSWLDRNDVDGTTIGDYRPLPMGLISAEAKARETLFTFYGDSDEISEPNRVFGIENLLDSKPFVYPLMDTTEPINEPTSAESKHYILMAGMRGYLPDYCEVFEDSTDAIFEFEGLCLQDDLLGEFEINSAVGELENQLRQHNSAYIDQRSYNLPYEYIEIQCCTCDTPAIHSDTQ